jgi:hypothetical protein
MAPVVTKKHRSGVKSFFDSLGRDAQRQEDSNREHIEEHDAMQKVRIYSFMMLHSCNCIIACSDEYQRRKR